jgi:hypothetical protein
MGIAGLNQRKPSLIHEELARLSVLIFNIQFSMLNFQGKMDLLYHTNQSMLSSP